MAKTNYSPKDSDPQDLRNQIESAIMADAYKITPNFFNDHKDKFENIKNSLGEIMSSYGYKQGDSTTNPLEKYKNVLFNTLNEADIKNEIMQQQGTNLHSGIRSLSHESTASGVENQIIENFQKLTQETFALMNEYRVGVSLIPEIKRVLKLVIRDILNSDELTKRSIKNVFTPSKTLSFKMTDEDVQLINDYIDVNITDKYKIEKLLPVWLLEMLITGAKPILVLPYKDILTQAITLAQNPAYKFSNEDYMRFDSDSLSTEALEDILYEKIDITSNEFSNIMKKEIWVEKPNRKPKYKATEDDRNYSFTHSYESIITDEIVESLYEEGLEELKWAYMIENEYAQKELAKSNFRFGQESADPAESAEIMETVKSLKDTIARLENDEKVASGNETEQAETEKDKVKKKIKSQLVDFLGDVDRNIEFVKDDYSGLHLGFKELSGRKKTKQYNKRHIFDGMYIKDKEKLEELTGNFDKDVLLLELDPECVIPITNGSEHVAYYVYERDAYVGATPSNTRKNSSFAELMNSTGYGNDAALLKTQSGISISPNDPSISSVFSPMSAMTPISAIGNGLDDIHSPNKRTEIMKQIIYKAISDKMGDQTLVDSKTFTDSIMNLIRQGYIVNRKVQFTYVPGMSMVYFAHDLDDKGLPHSILDGTLLKIYIYIACVISSTMLAVAKASDKEKLEVNIGLSNQIGMTLSEIQKNLSTRNVHVRSFFDNIGSVLRNTATYFRMTIPVIDGEKLYDTSSVDSNHTAEIDNEFMNDQLNSILSAIPTPPSIVNMINDVEFSRGIINQNVEYRNSIMEKQSAVTPAITKLYRLLAMYSKIETKVNLTQPNKEVSDTETKTDSDRRYDKYIDIADINVKLSVPMYLNMVSIAETFSNIEPVMESYIKYRYGEQVDDNVNRERINRAKKELIKIFAPNIDFDYINSILDRVDDDISGNLINTVKDKKVNDRLRDDLGDI